MTIAKNTSFLMNYKGEWSLSPAYDITYANGKHYTKNHQMSIVGKVNNFEQEDLVQLGVNNGIKKERTIEIIENTITVVSSFSQRAKKIGIREDLVILVKHDIDNRMRSL